MVVLVVVVVVVVIIVVLLVVVVVVVEYLYHTNLSLISFVCFAPPSSGVVDQLVVEL